MAKANKEEVKKVVRAGRNTKFDSSVKYEPGRNPRFDKSKLKKKH